ncbi:C-type lectin domain family 4 member M [Salmo trutta]|uniref:C-type lectin domain family 4 member M n=1 Tax=Salmo trutta TaxID=8032 RepID=UPI0011316540|nr:C-type lectin domain family 4 member M-like isoform X2 [Salmo trutta]XP_029599506.1 C-type lectin domain family 4 member M-like [Salmo trutta]
MSEEIYENSDGFKGKKTDETMNIDDHIPINKRPIMPRKKDLTGDQHSVFWQWWKRYSGAAAVCLGLLCVLLLAGIIGLLLYQRNQLTSSNTLTKERYQLQISGNNLTEERDQLQTSNNTLTKERDQQQTIDNTLIKERDQLQTSYNTLTKERDQLQTSYNTLTEERDQLQTRYNTLTKERDQLQKETEHLKQSLVEKVCPQGWKKLGSSCYYVSTESKSWEESRQDCRNREAHLVVINSQEKQTLVNWLCGRKSYVWIGLTDSVTEGTWKWVDDTPLTTKYWNSGEPNGGRAENCVYFYSWSSDKGEWWDYDCSYKYRWICEK